MTIQQTWNELLTEIASQAHVPGQPPVTHEEAAYLTRITPAAWAMWLDLFRDPRCREIAVFGATASRDDLLRVLEMLEDEIAERGA